MKTFYVKLQWELKDGGTIALVQDVHNSKWFWRYRKLRRGEKALTNLFSKGRFSCAEKFAAYLGEKIEKAEVPCRRREAVEATRRKYGS